LLLGTISPHWSSSPSTGKLLTPEALAKIEKGICLREEEVARSLAEIDAQWVVIALTRAELKYYHEAIAIFQTASTLVIEGVCTISLLNISGLSSLPLAPNTLVSHSFFFIFLV
jgi:hypothetical protein